MYKRHTKLKLMFFMKIAGIYLFFSILIGCTPQSINQTPTSGITDEWLMTFLKEPVCQPPCWENIVPGKTKIGNTLDLLNSVNNTINIKGPQKYPWGEQVDIQWEFSGNQGGGRILSDEKGETVIQIYLIPKALILDNVIKKYGDPDQIFVAYTESATTKDIYIIYTQLKMVLEARVSNENGKINIEKGSRIFRISLNQDGLIEKLKAKLSPPAISLKWNGYGVYLIQYPYDLPPFFVPHLKLVVGPIRSTESR